MVTSTKVQTSFVDDTIKSTHWCKKLEGRWWEDVYIFIQNVKPNIFDNESKNIFNNIVSYLVLLAMATTKKVYPIEFKGWQHKGMSDTNKYWI